MSFALNPSIFREYDIRGLAGKDLSAPFAERLGLAYAKHLRNRIPGKNTYRVSVGRDCRLSSDEYAESLIRGMRWGGLNVVDLGVCPTPLTYFSVFQHGLDGGIMVTGSHNPAEYNGFKTCVGKETIHGEEIQTLRKIMEGDLAPGRAEGSRESMEIIPQYVDHLAKILKPTKKLKIVADAGNGTAATVAPEVLTRLGADVIPLFCTLDGRFPNHHPDPTVPANLKALIETVRREKADFGVAFDGDSDRIGLVDEKGNVIYGDEIMVIFARDVLKAKPGATIISEVKSSHRLYNDIAKHGGVPLMWKTGHSLIKSKMKETGAQLAGEMSGHIFFADRYFGFDDAIYAAARLFEIATKAQGPMSSLVADLPKSFNTPEIRIDCEEAKKFELVKTVRGMFDGSRKVTDIDGVRADFGDGWGLLRASNTQPVLVMRFEATSPERLQAIQGEMQGMLIQAAKRIGHPPIDLHSGGH